MPRRVELLRDRRPFGDDRHLFPMQERPDDDVSGKERSQQQAGYHAGDKEVRDRDVGGDAVDDHDDRRRDQQPQRARAGQRADGDGLRVAAALELGQRHLADRRAGRRRGSRDCREDRAADDVGVEQPAGHALEPRRQALEHVLREPGAEQDLSHPDEQRQRGQRPRRCRTPDRHRHRVARRPRRKKLHPDPCDAGQRDAYPDAAAEQGEQRDDQQGRDQQVHRYSTCAGSSARTAGARPPKIAASRRSTNAIARMTLPAAIESCGIHSGVASLPVEMS